MIKQKLIREMDIEEHLNDGWLIKMVTPHGSFVIEREEQEQVAEMKAEDIVKSMSAFDEIGDDEIMYWSTPYYDQIQARKNAHREKLEEEKLKNG